MAGSNHESGVQIEPVGARVTGPQRGRRDVFRWVAAPADARTRSRPHGHAPVDRGGGRRGEDRRFLGPEVWRAAVRLAAEPATRERPATRRATSATTVLGGFL